MLESSARNTETTAQPRHKDSNNEKERLKQPQLVAKEKRTLPALTPVQEKRKNEHLKKSDTKHSMNTHRVQHRRRVQSQHKLPSVCRAVETVPSMPYLTQRQANKEESREKETDKIILTEATGLHLVLYFTALVIFSDPFYLWRVSVLNVLEKGVCLLLLPDDRCLLCETRSCSQWYLTHLLLLLYVNLG